MSTRTGDALGIGAVASFVLSGLAIEKLAQSLDAGGWIAAIGFSVTAILAISWLVVKLSARWKGLPDPPPDGSELRSLAEQSEHWLFALGSDADGMAAAEWFELNEKSLREALADEEPAAAEDQARIADALETWYVRRRQSGDLLAMSERLAVIGDRAGRRDVEELAAVRAATAYRLMGNLGAATTRLGVAASIATRGRTKAAMAARRQVERALVHLARADRSRPGGDRDEAVLNARDRLADARLSRPGPDLAADVAMLIDLGAVHLYLQEPDQALNHLRVAEARADAAGDASAHAHALELTGVAAWMRQSSQEAIAWWRRAERLYADVDEREGRARCLQHLGSAAWLEGRTDRAVELLDHSALLRGGTDGHDVLEYYLGRARGDLAEDEDPDPTQEARAPRRWWQALISRWLH